MKRDAMTVGDVLDGGGRWALLDLPLPLEPVIVDLDRPLEEQLPAGVRLEEARKAAAAAVTIVVNPEGA